MMITWNRVLGLLCALSLPGCASGFDEATESAVAAEQGIGSPGSCAAHRAMHPSRRHHEHPRFAVIGDPHLYDTSLGDTGEAFEATLQSDPKLLRESREILETVVNQVIEAHPDFVLVPGDMTKDGELSNHELFTRYLRRFERAGIAAFVVPGNHDLMNGHARRYRGTEAEPVPSTTEADFLRLYERFGYGQAILRDRSTLSYVAEVSAGLWLLALDSTRHLENSPGEEPVTAGRLPAETRAWALRAARLAAHTGKRTIAMMHHGLIEHFGGQKILFPDYVIEDAESLAKDLAQVGIRLVFTGHYHAQDIVTANFEDGTRITDVESGSLVTYPSPFRLVDFDLKHNVA
ncbi:MAG: metallophosphoesterase family protein, partial [Myxococcales bacterium]